MNRILPIIAATFALFLVGCSAPEAAAEAAKSEAPATPAKTPASPETASAPAAKGEVKIGMDAAEVKVVKGAPDSERHDHDAKGAHLDIWTYKDATITFTDGMVTKVE